jgi:hypothetical protein
MENTSDKQLNEEVAIWAKLQASRMRKFVGGLTLKTKMAAYKKAWAASKNADYKPLERSIGSGLKKDFGEVSRVNFRFERHGIFLEHGAGAGRSSKHPKPWIKPVLDPAIDRLADILSEKYGDKIEAEIKIVVPNVISRRIKITNG